MRDLKEGAQLGGRYTLLRQLGRGGMSVVWLARDSRSEGKVALKFLPADALGSASRRKRFHEEWRVSSRLMHAHIARVFEFHDDDDGPYYGQQFVDGVSIAELQGQPLEWVLRPVGLLADALRYAHGKGVVHGDLVAANVLLDRRGAPCLIDFGVSRDSESRVTAGGGTPAAQSPQQRAGQAAVAADDLYALGILIHELLAGMPPGKDGVATVDSNGKTLPAALRQLLRDLLATDPEARPTAAEVGTRLNDAGFAAGVAPSAKKANTAVEDIPLESITPRAATQGRSQPLTAARGAAASQGVPMVAVAAGLLVLLAAFIAVLFVLPAQNEAAGPGTVPTAGPQTLVSPATDEQAAGNDRPDGQPAAGAAGLPEDEQDAAFSENVAETGGDRAAQTKAATDEALGDLLSRLERLRYRGIERWGGQAYLDALQRYAEGDQAYVNKNYADAGDHYRATIEMLDPFFDRIDSVFRDTMTAARAAFEAQDHREAIRLYDLAVAITPGNSAAEKGLERARNLEAVLGLTERGREFEKNLEYEAARTAYGNALGIDPEWEPAEAGLARVRAALEQLSFERLMTDGFETLASGDLQAARAAFEAAKAMRPDSRQPADGLLQLDQAERLQSIRRLEESAAMQVANEQWEAAVDTFEQALSVDADLQFAQDGLRQARQRAALHRQLQEYIDNPDSLSVPDTMQSATQLLLNLSRIDPTGPRLADQKEALSRLLKRAATPLPVQLKSDNQTEVSIYRIGELGTFDSRQLELRPGTYVAVGSRRGYRDVRLEFRVAPEIEMRPIVVQCEERI